MAWDAITRIPVKDPYILREDVNLQFTPKQGPKIIQVKLKSVSLDFFAILAEDCSNPGNPRRYLSQPSGPDLVIEVPLSRWDVDQYFDPEAPRLGRSRHGFGICGSSLNHELCVCVFVRCSLALLPRKPTGDTEKPWPGMVHSWMAPSISTTNSSACHLWKRRRIACRGTAIEDQSSRQICEEQGDVYIYKFCLPPRMLGFLEINICKKKGMHSSTSFFIMLDWISFSSSGENGCMSRFRTQGLKSPTCRRVDCHPLFANPS